MPEIFYFDEVGSTNDVLKDMIKQGIESGTIVSAKKQSNGRGQYNRVWFSTKSALAFSVALKFASIPENFTVKIGECVKNSIIELCGFTPENMRIKLPNDILINDKKICGILTEAQSCGDTIWIICGIGINVNTKVIPKEIEDIATSIYLETGKELDLKQLMLTIHKKILKIGVDNL